MARKTNEGLLARVNFPLYSVEMLTSRHVLVAGGGGSSKTGVANGFVSSIPTQKRLNSNCFDIVYRKSMRSIIMGSVSWQKKCFDTKLAKML